jgi:hypothetical protein
MLGRSRPQDVETEAGAKATRRGLDLCSLKVLVGAGGLQDLTDQRPQKWRNFTDGGCDKFNKQFSSDLH